MERARQAEIKRKLDKIEKAALVHSVKVTAKNFNFRRIYEKAFRNQDDVRQVVYIHLSTRQDRMI